MAFAPTRSGKGVGLVVPTLLSWPSSAVIHDINGENWNLTAGWRSRFLHCLLFNPTDARSAANNPLLEVLRGMHEVRDVQNIADILVDPEGALERRNHWEQTSHALLVGAILHVLYASEDKTLHGVANFLSDPASPFEVTLHRMMITRYADAPPSRPGDWTGLAIPAAPIYDAGYRTACACPKPSLTLRLSYLNICCIIKLWKSKPRHQFLNLSHRGCVWMCSDC